MVSSLPHDLANVTELEKFMDETMNGQLETYKIPGATVAVVHNDSLLFSKGYGFADIDQSKPVIANQTMFRIGSVSKLFTWTAIMQLWEQGQVELDKDINSHFTTFQIPSTYPEPITLYHLMSHSAGFEDQIFGFFARDPGDLKSLADYCAQDMPARVRPPGEVSAYSNYGVALAGYIVELVSGMPFEEYIAEYIYKPLGMNQSTFFQPVPSELATNLAIGYSLVHEDGSFDAEEVTYSNGRASGAMWTTARDIAQFMIAHLQNGSYGSVNLLMESTAQKMHTRSFSHDPRVNGWSHGWEETTVNGQRLITHGGDVRAFHSLLVLSLEHNMGLFVSYSNDNGLYARYELLNAFMDYYFPASAQPVSAPLSNHAARISQYVGTYRSTRASYTSAAKIAFNLLSSMQIGTDGAGRLILGLDESMLEVLGLQRQYIEVEPLFFLPVNTEGNPVFGDNYLVFRENNRGEITYMFINNDCSSAFERLPWNQEPGLHVGILIVCSLMFFVALLLEPIHFVIKKLRKQTHHAASDPSKPEIHNAHWLSKHGRGITRGLCAGTSGLFLLFLFLFLILVALTINDAYFGLPPVAYLIFSIPLVGAVLTGLVTGFIGLAWKKRYWEWGRRTFHSITLVFFLLFLVELNYWNLLGFHF
ncbi:MAG: serine hydrolase domain-containing protein [Candidatus Hodarchaeota archaeon]